MDVDVDRKVKKLWLDSMWTRKTLPWSRSQPNSILQIGARLYGDNKKTNVKENQRKLFFTFEMENRSMGLLLSQAFNFKWETRQSRPEITFKPSRHKFNKQIHTHIWLRAEVSSEMINETVWIKTGHINGWTCDAATKTTSRYYWEIEIKSVDEDEQHENEIKYEMIFHR